jgi:sarcosine oxidase
VSVGLGAGHGFKFASVIGRILVERALDGRSPSDDDIGPFNVDRPILQEASPTTHWLV